ncbi:uncharacterized protein LOC112603181 [Melanaphis sacchari]|uniref:uncharacterized protein LOC112603181 n=1 Tax=Melanaphis sacchari TaxID=742174 RepID=UPI000DC136C9|nr:uncharacterized protein LOC112603181 [Melanaphis sacchari]
MDETNCSKKRKGGAEKIRDKKKKILLLEAKASKSIESFFKSQNSEVTDSCINNVSLEKETFSIGNKDNANIGLNVIESIDHQKSVNNEVIPKSNNFTKGLDVWSHTYIRIDEHDKSTVHKNCVSAFFHHSNKFDIGSLLFCETKKEIKKNRKIVTRVIEAVKLIGKRGLTKYDFQMKDHLETIIKKSRKAHESGSKGRGGLVTFISKTTVDYVIAAISRLIKKSICDEVKNAKIYAVMLDTTQDITSSDQCAVVLRYVDDNGIHESLIAVVNCSDSTGKGMHDLLQNVLLLNDLNVKNCIANTTDGAANMQGEYNGFSAWLNESSPNQVHVWCYSHVLNLVLSDASKSPLAAASLFNLCNSLAVFFKDSHKRMRVWTERCHNLHQRLQSIGETRWWSKEVALVKIFGSTEGPCKSNALIFSITGPLSRYLQSKSMDLITAQNLVDGALEHLKKVQRNMEWIKLSAESFVIWANTELDLQFNGDSPITKFEIEVHNRILDIVVESINKRFIKHRKLYNDLSCLSPSYFSYIIQNGLPDQALTTLCDKLKSLNSNITYNGLKDELIHFAKNWDKLKKSLAESFATSYSLELTQDEEDDIESKINHESQNMTCKSCKNCVVCCYNILQKYNLYCDAYANLFLAYKYVLTLPSTQVSCERSFSFLKNIKSRLRNQLSDPKLEAFMLMAIEKQKLTLLDSDKIIEELQKES